MSESPDPRTRPAELVEEFGQLGLPKLPAEVDPERRHLMTARLRSASLENLSPRRQHLKDTADAVRQLIGRLVATDAPDEVLDEVRAALQPVIAAFDGHDQTDHFGFAETANAGATAEPIFDQSPLIGVANPLAPPMAVHEEGDEVIAFATFGQAYEGPPGCVHGGYVAAAFDEVLGATQSLSGAPGMTGTLTVRYEAPTPLHTEIRFESRIQRVEGRKIFVEGESHAGGTITARATGVFISLRAESFLKLLAAREEAGRAIQAGSELPDGDGVDA